MQPEPPEPEDRLGDPRPDDADRTPAQDDPEKTLVAFVEDVLKFIDRDKARKRPLPRSAKFASTFQAGVVDVEDRDPIKARAPGTDLRPDDDVREMDASVPPA